MSELSGVEWCQRFPTSVLLGSLVEPFRSNVTAFNDALRAGRMRINITCTWRPAERAYCMHYASQIKGYRDAKTGVTRQIMPAAVPPMEGVDIDWAHGGDLVAARQAAQAMCSEYGIVYPPALLSNHTQRTAIDETISWDGEAVVRDARGVVRRLDDPRDGSNPILAQIGRTYGVMKLVGDIVHWSADGH